MTPPRERLGDDAGITLVELLISMVVGGIVLSLIGTIFVTTLQATAATRDRDLATGQAQAISTSLTTSIRNAHAVTLDSVPGGGQVVRAHVATGTPEGECRAWAVVDLETFDSSGRRAGTDGHFELRAYTYTPLPPTAARLAPTAAWGVLTEHVEQVENAAGTAQPYFGLEGKRVSWNLAVSVAEEPQLNAQSVAPVAGSAVALAHQGGTLGC